jgi:hypothetical protein
MTLIAKKKESNIESIEPGTYTALCVGVIDLGVQFNEKFKNYSAKIMFIFEIASERIEVDGVSKPRWLSKEYTLALGEKSNLTKILTAWRGKAITDEEEAEGIDTSSLIGQGCMIQVIIKNEKYNDITSIIQLPKGVPVPPAENDILLFDMADWNNDIFDKIPTWIQDKIKKSTQYQEKHLTMEKIDIPKEIAGENKKVETSKVGGLGDVPNFFSK